MSWAVDLGELLEAAREYREAHRAMTICSDLGAHSARDRLVDAEQRLLGLCRAEWSVELAAPSAGKDG